jgi:PPK2 family polyphosphate:nucleotide phosphotransferase
VVTQNNNLHKKMDWEKCRVKRGKNLNLSKINTRPDIKKSDKNALKAQLEGDIVKISNLQNKLYAENRQSLLIILQGMDSAGKDSTIKHIMRGVNPQGVSVHSFKHPSTVEMEHDYLWRYIQHLPEHGQIAIFNRSYYENVLIAKVHPSIVLAERLPGIDSEDKIGKDFWTKRYEQINYFEKENVQNGISILKFFLHLSKKEQAKRFLERIEQPEKHWKFSVDDISERKFWDDYESAYEQALRHTSKKNAPWFIIPADDKQYAHRLIGKIILEKLKSMKPSFPPIDKEEKALMMKAKAQLIKENRK